MINLGLKKVEGVIKKIVSLDYNDEFAYEKILLAFLEIPYLPAIIGYVPKGTIFFRSRTLINDIPINKISEISLPPSSCVSSFARCNRPFQSKFYCSENRQTSYIEQLEYWSKTKQPGDYLSVVIGRWILKNEMPTLIVTSPKKENRTSNYDKYHGAWFDDYISKFEGETLDAIILFYDFLFEYFRKPVYQDCKTYLITSAYCNLAMSKLNNLAVAINYPSVPFNGEGVNYCINSEFLNFENIKIDSAMFNEFYIELNEDRKHSFIETKQLYTTKVDTIKDIIEW